MSFLKRTKLKVKFTSISNDLINDKNLSLPEKSMYIYLCSKPDNWSFSVARIAKHINETEHTIKRTIRGLEHHNLLERQMSKGDNGKFDGMDYILNDYIK